MKITIGIVTLLWFGCFIAGGIATASDDMDTRSSAIVPWVAGAVLFALDCAMILAFGLYRLFLE